MFRLISSRTLAATSVGVLVALGTYLFGFLTADQRWFPSQHIQNGKTRVRGLSRLWKPETSTKPEASGPTPQTRSLSTLFVRLRLDEISVPVPRAGTGGGLTSVGEEVLLLSHDGTVFALSDHSVRQTSIRVPDNGFHAYQAAAATDRYRALQHDFKRFRYNDILFYSHATGAGLVVSYTEWLQGEECYGTTIARLPLSQADDSSAEIEASRRSWEIVYRTQPCLPLKREFRALEGHMAGGRMAYVPPNTIMLGSGDYSWDGVYAPDALSQLESNDYGKVLEIDLDRKTARQVALGLRNLQGMVVDKAGQIWAVEQGPRGGDELNRIVEGHNYGWPEVTLGTRYSGLPVDPASPYGRHDGFAAPTYAWVPSVSTSGLTQVDRFHSSWDGDLLVSSLEAESLFRLRITDERVVFAEPIFIGHRIRSVLQHTHGRIVLWTDSNRLIVISRNDVTLADAFIDEMIGGFGLSSDREAALRNAMAGCAACHSFGADENPAGPSLSDIFERPIASRPLRSYSQGLRAHKGGAWTERSLTDYLDDPGLFAPGTTMPDPELSTTLISDLVRVIRGLRAAE